MVEDYHKFAKEEGILTDDKCEMNFNRKETLTDGSQLFLELDIIQRDIYLKSPMHYLLELEEEIDFLVEKVF